MALSFGSDHNCVVYLKDVPRKYSEFEDVITFLQNSRYAYAMCANPTIVRSFIQNFWESAEVEVREGNKCVVGNVLPGRELVVSERMIRRSLKLGNDDEYPIEYDKYEVLTAFQREMGYVGNALVVNQLKKSLVGPKWKFIIHCMQHCFSRRKCGWDDINVDLSSAIVGLVSNQGYNMSGYIMKCMMRNIQEDRQSKFLMYPRFLQIMIDDVFGFTKRHRGEFLEVTKHDTKVFGHMKRKNARRDYHINDVRINTYMRNFVRGRIDIEENVNARDYEIDFDNLDEERPSSTEESEEDDNDDNYDNNNNNDDDSDNDESEESDEENNEQGQPHQFVAPSEPSSHQVSSAVDPRDAELEALRARVRELERESVEKDKVISDHRSFFNAIGDYTPSHLVTRYNYIMETYENYSLGKKKQESEELDYEVLLTERDMMINDLEEEQRQYRLRIQEARQMIDQMECDNIGNTFMNWMYYDTITKLKKEVEDLERIICDLQAMVASLGHVEKLDHSLSSDSDERL